MSFQKSQGGVGLNNLKHCNKAFGGKLVWKLYTNPASKWCQIMQDKYLDNNQPSRVLTILDSPKGSAIWNFMMDSRNLVTKYISWEVNNGFSANFWTDSWCGHPPIAQMDNMEDIMNITIAHWGTKLSDCVCYRNVFQVEQYGKT